MHYCVLLFFFQKIKILQTCLICEFSTLWYRPIHFLLLLPCLVPMHNSRPTYSYNCGCHLKVIKTFLEYSNLKVLYNIATWKSLRKTTRSTGFQGKAKLSSAPVTSLFCMDSQFPAFIRIPS